MNTTDTAESISDENVKRLLQFFRDGISKINFSNYENVVLILGNTGTGKSTLAHFLASDNNKLESVSADETIQEYTIKDSASKIGSVNSIISQTIVPELIYDRDTNTAYIDCPGFNDNRNEAYDIAIAYFIKKVMDDVKHVKILLALSYSAVRPNGERNDILYLLEHVSILFKNIDKYVDSLAVVVTKVDNVWDPISKNLIPDEKIVASIARRLKDAKSSIMQLQQSPQVYNSEHVETQKNIFYQNSICLLSLLIENQSRIGIFRRPDREGKLSDIEILQKGKTNVKNMIASLKYSPLDKLNIGYAVSDKSKNIIRELASNINEIIAADIGHIGQVVIEYYNYLEEKMLKGDMLVLLDRLKHIYKVLTRIRDNNADSTELDFIGRIRDGLDKPCLRASKRFVDNIYNLIHFLSFLQEVNGKKLDSFVWKWAIKLNDVINDVNNSVKWFEFVASLYESLSKYEVQKDRSAHVPSKLDACEGILEKCADFIAFVEQIHDPDLFEKVSLKELKKISISSHKVPYYDKVIESTMESHPTYQLFNQDQRLLVIGEYIKFSDILKNETYRSSKSVQILATHTVFIDADLIIENDLLVMGPRWNTIDSRLISLDGKNGEWHYLIFAAHGRCEGCKGADGLPGNPGESAGHFFGVAMDISNPSGLRISASGGNGGNGQHGGYGKQGYRGRTAVPSLQNGHFKCDTDFVCELDYAFRENKPTSDKFGIFALASALHCRDIYGKLEIIVENSGGGGRGGDCGLGGAPGLGGHAGTIDFIKLGNENLTILTHATKGDDGDPGFDGVVGEGGAEGDPIVMRFDFQNFKDPVISYFDHTSRRRILGRIYKNIKGTCRNSTIPLDKRERPAKKEILYNPYHTVSNFRNLFVNIFFQSIMKRESFKFYQLLHENERISKYDSIHSLFAEMSHLEIRFNYLNSDIDGQILHSLKERFRKLVQTMPCSKDSDNECELLDLFSLTVTSKLIRCRTHETPQLGSNFRTYIDLLKGADASQLWKYFTDAIKDQQRFEETFLNVVDIDLHNIVENVIKKIVEESSQPVAENLGNLLLKGKLFYSLQTMLNFLKLCRSLASAEIELVTGMSISKIVPSVQVELPAVDGEEILRDFGMVEEIIQYELDVVELAVSSKFNLADDLYFNDVNQVSEIKNKFKSYKINNVRSYGYPVLPNAIDMVREIVSLHKSNDKFRELIKSLESDFKYVEFDAHLYHKLVMKRVPNLDFLDSTIDSLREHIPLFNAAISEMFDIMRPVLITVRGNLKDAWYIPDDLPSFRKMICEALTQLRSLLHSMINKFKSVGNSVVLIENLEEVVALLLNTYQQILPSHHDRTLLYKLNSCFENKIAEIAIYKDMDNSIKDDILLYEYEHLWDIYKKSIFPFDILFPESFSPTSMRPVLEPLSLIPHKGLIISGMEKLELKLNELENHEDFNVEQFSADTSNGAFFTWGYQYYGDTLKKLFRGRKVTLKAKITNRNLGLLRFNSIGLRFHLNDSARQEEFHDVMKSFKVTMIHSGLSYFTLCDRIHIRSQDSTKYNFDVESGLVSCAENEECSSKKRPTRSPFTAWSFEMKPIQDGAGFEPLERFGGLEIDLELEGEAKFIRSLDDYTCVKVETRSESNDEKLTTDDGAKGGVLTRGENDLSNERVKRGIISDAGGFVIGVVEQSAKPITDKYPVADRLVQYFKDGVNLSAYLVEKSVDFVVDGVKWGTGVVSDGLDSLAKLIIPEPVSNYEYFASQVSSTVDGVGNKSYNLSAIEPYDLNSTLVLLDYVIRNITDVKHSLPKLRPLTPPQAQIMAMVIVDEFRSTMTETQWQAVDPVQLMGKLEGSILKGDGAAIQQILLDYMPKNVTMN